MIEILPTVKLVRLEESYKYGTFGVLLICDQTFCVTLEPCDKENKPFESSIPAQQYSCKRIISPKFGETFKICNVPNRDSVLLHSGNEVEDTLGCVLLASSYGKLHEGRAILNSGKTFQSFMEVMQNWNAFNLTIKEVY